MCQNCKMKSDKNLMLVHVVHDSVFVISYIFHVSVRFMCKKCQVYFENYCT